MEKKSKIIEKIAELEELLSKKLKSIELSYELALLSYDAEDFYKSIQYCDEVLKLEPNSHVMWFAKGMSLKKLNKLNESLMCCRQSIKISHDFYPAHVELASILFKNAISNEEIDHAVRASKLSLKYFLNSIYIDSKNDATVTYPLFKIKHDLEQAKYLIENNISTPVLLKYIDQMSQIIINKSRVRDGLIYLTSKENIVLERYLKEPHVLECEEFENYLNPSLDWNAIEENYFKSEDKVIYIDDFLQINVLNWLIKFSLESKVWYKEYRLCYLGAFADTGFLSKVHLNIAKELRKKLPNIVGEYDLEQLWGFKYDSKLGDGINVHADFAKINLNFWITPDMYNVDANSGGMLVYTHPAPQDWKPEEYNQNFEKIYKYLDKNKSRCKKICYKQNRAVLFNSSLFHETDKINFLDEYIARRINITYLFGKQLFT